MSQNDQLRTSRHLPIAEVISGVPRAEVLRKFEGRLLITGAADRIITKMGRMMLTSAANQIARFARRIDLILGDVGIEADVRSELLLIDSTLDVRRSASACERYAAVLSIGRSPVRQPNLVEIDGAGWVAYLSPGRLSDMNVPAPDANPFGPLVATALGASEVFKHLVGLDPAKGSLLDSTSFSVLNLSPDTAAGSALPETVQLPSTLLAGVGAVGNAFLFALHQVAGISGELVVVDSQALDDSSNLNRYLLATEADLQRQPPMPKVDLARRLFSDSLLSIHPLHADVKDIAPAIAAKQIPRPQILVSALDNNEPRYVVQTLWPDFVIEGATGDTVAQVFRHQYGKGLACLRCIHPPNELREISYAARIHELSGISIDWLREAENNPSLALSGEALVSATPEVRALLLKSVGRPACSVLADVEGLSTKDSSMLPYQPAVSFVSAMAGFLAAAEVVKVAVGLPSPIDSFYYADLMFPLHSSILQRVQRLSNCYCVERQAVIDEYRRQCAAM